MVDSIMNINGIEINVVDWETENPKAVLLIVHGYAEHSHRYEHVAKFFNSHSFHVRSFDFYGHGRSGGVRAYVKSFDRYVGELEYISKMTMARFSELPAFILGHSMGGTVTGIAAAKGRLHGFENIILSNPALDVVSNQPSVLVSLIRLLAPVFPKLKTTKLSSEFISRDPIEREKYDTDPYNYRQGTRPGFANEFDKASSWLFKNAKKVKQSLYLKYSLSDKVVVPEASEVFYRNVSSIDKSKTQYEGLYHELLNEPEKEEVMENILKWCIARF